MTRFAICAVVMILAMVACSTTYGQEAPDQDFGIRLWALGGLSPEFGQAQELRVGYAKLLPDIEFAVGAQHWEYSDGSDEWPLRAYVMAHAIDANMIASVIGHGAKLPDGKLYLGLFGQYTDSRDEAWSAGWMVGGRVSWPGKWETVLELQNEIWNRKSDGVAVFTGLERGA